MSSGYRAVQWNRYKVFYDATLVLAVSAYIAAYLLAWPLLWPSANPVNDQIQRMRAFGSCAYLMLTVILCIGPLARIDARFLPLLYNRRHLGVATFLVALFHAVTVLDWYHGHGTISPLVSLLISNPRYLSFQAFPFEALGLAALILLLVMAAISHDFWLAFLTPPVWKAIHMLVYPAYGVLVMHVALGVMQSEASSVIPVLVAGTFALVTALHIAASQRDRNDEIAGAWLDIGTPDSIPDEGAIIVSPAGAERIAVFRYQGRVSAVSNVCAHQNGPLGEGRIIDGCITCPWHGFQYRPEDGCAPPPFTEKLSTFRLRLVDGRVQVARQPLPPGTFVEPLMVATTAEGWTP